MQLDLFVIICLHFTRQTFSLWNGDLTIIPAAALQRAVKMSHVLDFRGGLGGRANAPFIARLEGRDGWLWKIAANLWNKKPWRNTDDEITPGTRRNAYRERCSSRGPKTDPQLCEIRRIFSSSALRLLSKNPGKQLYCRCDTAVSPQMVQSGCKSWESMTPSSLPSRRKTWFLI